MTTTQQMDKLSSEIKVRFVDDGFRPYFDESEEPRQVYRVFLRYNGKNTSFLFGDSLQNGYDGIMAADKPQEYKNTILDIIVSDSYTPEDFEDFCQEFGYEEDSRKAYTIFKKCVRQSEKIHKLFSDAELEKLDEELRDAGFR
jgi:TusA-related sulfurtransferase